MKNLKEKIKKVLEKLNAWKFTILVIIIFGGLFYWYQVRPSRIYSKCDTSATTLARDLYKFNNPYNLKEIERGIHNRDSYDSYYKKCLRSKGINK